MQSVPPKGSTRRRMEEQGTKNRLRSKNVELKTVDLCQKIRREGSKSSVCEVSRGLTTPLDSHVVTHFPDVESLFASISRAYFILFLLLSLQVHLYILKEAVWLCRMLEKTKQNKTTIQKHLYKLFASRDWLQLSPDSTVDPHKLLAWAISPAHLPDSVHSVITPCMQISHFKSNLTN